MDRWKDEVAFVVPSAAVVDLPDPCLSIFLQSCVFPQASQTRLQRDLLLAMDAHLSVTENLRACPKCSPPGQKPSAKGKGWIAVVTGPQIKNVTKSVQARPKCALARTL